jgi:four helix bundle protein
MGYDLEPRTLAFAEHVRDFLGSIPKTFANQEYSKQLIRSSSSVGANYIEANEAISRKDFFLHIKISRKESKESGYWLKLLDLRTCEQLQNARDLLLKEAMELVRIFASIVNQEK